MSSFNDINGVPASGNRWLLTDVLRGEWGFPGFVVSDYTSDYELILHGVATGEPTARMGRELGCDRKHLLELRHRLQEHARRGLDRDPLDDAVVEADKMYQDAGEEGRPAPRPGRPAAAAG